MKKISLNDLDAKDKKILSILQKNAKATTKSIAFALDLSPTAVFERVKKLEKSGIINRYVALLNKVKVRRDFEVLCQVKLIQHKQEYIGKFEKEIVQFPEVLSCFHVSGEYDYLIKIGVSDIKTYRQFMVEKLTKMQYIASTQSNFVIQEVKDTTELFVD